MAQEEKRKNEKKLDTKHFTKTERRGLGFKIIFSQDFSVYCVSVHMEKRHNKNETKLDLENKQGGVFNMIFSKRNKGCFNVILKQTDFMIMSNLKSNYTPKK